jgi:3-oxoacyl-[acyl-carrier protein] reductase
MTQPRIQARTAIVFGGSRGIGAAIAQRLAADGANVVLTYVSAPNKATEVVAAIEQHGGTAMVIRADSANRVGAPLKKSQLWSLISPARNAV